MYDALASPHRLGGDPLPDGTHVSIRNSAVRILECDRESQSNLIGATICASSSDLTGFTTSFGPSLGGIADDPLMITPLGR
jgi:hypothetical protein